MYLASRGPCALCHVKVGLSSEVICTGFCLFSSRENFGSYIPYVLYMDARGGGCNGTISENK